MIDLGNNNMKSSGILAIAEALKSGRCPIGLRLELASNYIESVGIEAIVDALVSGQCPAGLTLDLSGNKVGAHEMQAITKALHSGQCPLELALYLGKIECNRQGIQALMQVLRTKNLPFGLKLDCNFSSLAKKIIDNLLKEVSYEHYVLLCLTLQLSKSKANEQSLLHPLPQDCLNLIYTFFLLR